MNDTLEHLWLKVISRDLSRWHLQGCCPELGLTGCQACTAVLELTGCSVTGPHRGRQGAQEAHGAVSRGG